MTVSELKSEMWPIHCNRLPHRLLSYAASQVTAVYAIVIHFLQ